ncbi:hypothetical protein [Methylobacterium gnaphalii]|uniref:Uncharacterized protein n=1 Tax=Methylobacterium gnaphalii TaxID=1010610 RepID=A0A512JG00_9HYPH|nr:hypothetical protein [Methylobacterium gnaphalii]GEP08863.1 hypothetical protein MGN01_07080 [Methylobacterium gnaphalii]GJD70355.1 hypothetical protein MMMDOFMJ_3301 [Methylobacterium gnaphalii]GLS47628.1 hypothetical protein GCM10007885_04720 [Methylobacterium gnaphalii]
MSSDRHIVRLMAAMILAIIAYLAPSAVQAHEGHAHHGHHLAAAMQVDAPSPITAAATPSPSAGAAMMPVLGTMVLAVGPGAAIWADDARGGCCPAACKGSCCGTMVCCASGILGAFASLSVPLSRTVVLIPQDVDVRSGAGPEALPKPPRTLA